MSISLSQDSVLQRVLIEADDLVADQVRVERSVDELVWTVVRGGVEVAPVAGEITLSDYEWPDEIESFYRVVDADDDAVLESDSITPSLDGQVWVKSVIFPALNRPLRVRNWEGIGRGARRGLHEVKGSAEPIATSDRRASAAFDLTIRVPISEIDDTLILLADGGVLFLHTPAGSRVPGGYVSVGDVSQDRVVRHDDFPEVWSLPCRVVRPPGPRVTGGTQPFLASLNAWPTYEARSAGGRTYAETTARVAAPDEHEVAG